MLEKITNNFRQLYLINKNFFQKKLNSIKKSINNQPEPKKVTKSNIDECYNSYNPVFILTTGRTGSKFIADTLNYFSDVDAYHEPHPNLKLTPNIAYENYDSDFLKDIIWSVRTEIIFNSFAKNNKYIESNQCMTFFAYAINDLFPNSKFIHLVREPESFVLSAYKLKWYVNKTFWELGRLEIDSSTTKKNDYINKLYNLWHITNEFILEFGDSIKKDRFTTVKSEELFNNNSKMKEIVNFIGVKSSISDNEIKKIQNKKINTKKNEKRNVTIEEKQKIIDAKNKIINTDLYKRLYLKEKNNFELS